MLLATHPEGLELSDSWGRPPGAAGRQLRNLIRKTGAPVELVSEGRRLRLVEVEPASPC